VAGRASIVGAAATHVGKVREHNEDSHYFDADLGVFLVCDGMGGHAAGEVASAIAIRTIRSQWGSRAVQKQIDAWLEAGAPDEKKELMQMLRDGVATAHENILGEARRDLTKKGMGTTLVGAMIVGNELVFAHAGDSRAYLVRDGISLQLTEDHTLLARLLAAGIDVDQSGEGSRFKSMLTNALGIGEECKVSTLVVPLADGDRFLLCSDGISEYVPENEVGEVLSKQPSPARAAQKLIELALERGGADNATAIVVRVLEAGETPQPAEAIKRDADVIASCPLWSERLTQQQRLRAQRIAILREHAIGERIAASTLGDRVAWIIVEGKAVLGGNVLEPGALLYPESLVADSQSPDRDGLAVARTDVRALALRADDFRELCEDDAELGEALLERLAPLVAARGQRPSRSSTARVDTVDDPERDSAIASAYTKPEPPIDTSRVPKRATSPVSLELEQRFDAVTATPVPGAETTVIPPSTGERVPLILRPREPGEPPDDSVPTPIDDEAPSGSGEVVELEPSMVKAPRPRPPTAPEIETVIEIEADDAAPGEPEIQVMDSGTVAEVTVSEVGDAKVTETIVETSEATMSVTTVDESPAERPHSDASEPEIIIATEPVTSERAPSTSGTITAQPDPRPKRVSEGWGGDDN
jgi:PPM family protein phosphatase